MAETPLEQLQWQIDEAGQRIVEQEGRIVHLARSLDPERLAYEFQRLRTMRQLYEFTKDLMAQLKDADQ